MRYRQRWKYEETDSVNLTPLIDVVFVILVGFILVAPLLEVDRIHLGEGAGREKMEKDSSLRLVVKDNTDMFFNHQKITLADLKTSLSLAHQTFPKASLQLLHDENAPFGLYQKIKNIAEQVGIEEIEIVLKEGQ